MPVIRFRSNISNSAEPEITLQGPLNLFEVHIRLLDVPSFATSLNYNLYRMSSQESLATARCACETCRTYTSVPKTHNLRKYNPEKYATTFAPIRYRKVGGDPEISFIGLDEAFEYEYAEDPDNTEAMGGKIRLFKDVNTRHLLRIVTYLTPVVNRTYGSQMYDLIISCSHLYDVDLEALLANYDKQMAQDFLRKIMIFFTQSWQAFSSGDTKAEFSAFQTRRFLTHIIGFPSIAAEVFEVITTPEFWPEIGPVPILEALFERYLCCIDTASLLCNLTRIQKVAEHLSSNTQCVHHLQNNRGFAKALAKRDELGLLLLNLALNLVPYEGFAKFLIEYKSGYIVDAVILPLIDVNSTFSSEEKTVWPLLRNLVMTDEGRKHVMDNLYVFLGLILNPVAGPEELTPEEIKGLPAEVQWLPLTKQRVEDRTIRECILDIIFSLCRFRKDRERLRTTNMYHILKYYHLAEEDAQLLEKIEVVVNVLIREEGSEIEVDDLLEGLSLEDGKSVAATSGPIMVPGSNPC